MKSTLIDCFTINRGEARRLRRTIAVSLVLTSFAWLPIAMAFDTPSSSERTANTQRSGISCTAGAPIHYEVSGDYGRIGDILIGRIDDLSVNCIEFPTGLSKRDGTFTVIESRKEMFKAGAVRWPGGVVPFIVNDNVSAELRLAITGAAEHFRRFAPMISLVPRSDQANWIEFIQYESTPCGASLVGMQGRGQVIFLNATGPGCATVGVVVHEVMHALGFFHEQQRADRDDYLHVDTSCLATAADKAQYDKAAAEPFGPFDYASIMLYQRSCAMEPISLQLTPDQLKAWLQFTPISRCTDGVISHDGERRGNIGNRCALSFGDVQALRYFYGTPLLHSDALNAVTSLISDSCSLDIDGNGSVSAATDGLLLLRRLLGFGGTRLVDGAVGTTSGGQSPIRPDANSIERYVDELRNSNSLDLDGDGKTLPTTDGLIALRAMLGMSGSAALAGVTGSTSVLSWTDVARRLRQNCDFVAP